MGENRGPVINNIKNATEKGEFNITVELNDPQLSTEQKTEILNKYIEERDTVKQKVNNKIGRIIAAVGTHDLDKNMQIIGLENIKNIKTGAIMTSNHFNPLDSVGPRRVAKIENKKRLYVVGKETNLAMPGLFGYIMNHIDIIPISNVVSYMKNDFQTTMKEKLDKKKFILVYPEQEMWFNYRKPRPLKIGAYYYAAKFNVPIISCFTEIQDREEMATEEFYEVDYIFHILPTIYPDKSKSIKENARRMMEIDYEQKKTAYEKAYNKKLTYQFDLSDIAGLAVDKLEDMEKVEAEV